MESLAGQLGIADASVLNLYAQRSQASYEHAAEICAVYGYVDFADPDRREELRLFLSARAWTSSKGPVRLYERSVVWLRERKVLLPGVSTLTRLVSEVRAGANERLYAALVDAAGPALIRKLEGLLRVGCYDSRASTDPAVGSGGGEASEGLSQPICCRVSCGGA